MELSNISQNFLFNSHILTFFFHAPKIAAIFCSLRKRADAETEEKNHTLLPCEGQDGDIQSVRSEEKSRMTPSTDVIVQNAHSL